jgi:hypothetical protein
VAVISFFRPVAWGWAGLALVIALVYLWHFRRKQHEVATFFLWQRALARRPVWFRLRFWGSLLTQCLALLLLVAALAEPYWPQLFAARRNLVLVLDVSASMSATDVQPTRFAVMQTEAQRAAAALRRGESMAVLAAGSLIRVVCPFTGDKAALATAISEATPTDGTTRVVEAVELARRMLAGRPNPRIMVVADGDFPEAAALAAAEDVQFHVVHGAARNLGLTWLGFESERSAAGGQRGTAPPAARPPAPSRQEAGTAAAVLVEVANYSAEASEARIVSNGGPGPRVQLPAGGTAYPLFPVRGHDGQDVSYKLEGTDHLAADDVVTRRVTAPRRPRVTVVAAGTPALEAALRTLSGFDVKSVATLPDEAESTGILVLHRTLPRTLPAGPLLVIDPAESCNLWEVAKEELSQTAAAVARVGDNLALLEGVALGDVLVDAASRLKFVQPVELLAATAADDPLYAAIERPEGRVLVLAVKLDKSDLTQRRDFPRLLENALTWLRPAPTVALPPATTAEVVTLPLAKSPWRLKPPRGAEVTLPAEANLALLDHVGTWTATSDGGQTTVLASNLVSAPESDLRPGTALPSDQLDVPEAVGDGPLWMLLVGLALILLVAEWCLFHRRILV